METEILISIFQIFVAIGIFAILAYIGKYLANNDRLMSSFKNSRFANPLEYFPSEEIFSLNQVSYLIMILIFIVISLYLTFDWADGSYFIRCLDIIISIYLAVKLEKESFKGKLMLFLLIPFGSITGLLYGDNIVVLLDIFHIIGYLYYVKVYFRKFMKYTENNGLGITIMLLFAIVTFSFIFTIIVEGVSPMDSMTMVTNAFTSNSYEASGKIMAGKINSLIIAWGGFILSGVGTATLAASIVNRYVDREFEDIKDIIRNKKEEN